MIRSLRFFILSLLCIGLVSCGHKKDVEPLESAGTSAPAVQVKPLPPLTSQEVPSRPPQSFSHKVGLLLPLSGPHKELGKGMLNAAEMALFEAGSSSVTLLPQDTAQGAHQAALKALDEGAELLLGPIFSQEAEAIKPLIHARGVSLICFSTDQNIAGNGTYILGFLPSQQVKRVVQFAQSQGVTKIAAFTPNDAYGHLIDQSLSQLQDRGTIDLIGITQYSKSDLLDGNPGNTQLREAAMMYKDKGAEAFFLPEGGENLAHLVRILSPERPQKFLGSGQWDSRKTISIQGISGGIFASTQSQERQNFEDRFQKAYGYQPPRIATLAYDAMALALALADKGYTPQNLTFSQGFSGVDGLFRLTPEGLNERGLAILEVEPSGFRTLSPAPQSF